MRENPDALVTFARVPTERCGDVEECPHCGGYVDVPNESDVELPAQSNADASGEPRKDIEEAARGIPAPDEPTNDLDVGTMRVLEQGLIGFPGCAMVISHDRFFLDRIATHLLIMEGNGKTRWFEGNFADYERVVLAKDPERVAHRRNKYKRLTLR